MSQSQSQYRRKKAKRTIYQACSGNDKANADTFLANLKQGNSEMLSEYLL